MQRTADVSLVVVKKSDAKPKSKAVKLPKEADAAHAMWLYYRDHKAQLHQGVRASRDTILRAIMTGTPVDLAFQPFAKPTVAAVPVRLAA